MTSARLTSSSHHHLYGVQQTVQDRDGPSHLAVDVLLWSLYVHAQLLRLKYMPLNLYYPLSDENVIDKISVKMRAVMDDYHLISW